MNFSNIRKNFWDMYYPILVTLIFIGLSILLITRHEFWRDEALVWQIATSSRNLVEFFHIMQDSHGTPFLWNFLIYISSHNLSQNPESIKIIHLLISSTTAFLILKYSPFKITIKTLLVFSYFLFYEYSIISRNYALGIFLLVIFCILYNRKNKNYYLSAIILFLMGQVNIFAFIISLILFVYLLIDIYRQNNATRKKIYFIISILIMVLEIIIVAWQLNTQFFGEIAFGSNFSSFNNQNIQEHKNILINTSGGNILLDILKSNSLLNIASGIIKSFIHIPEINLNFWNKNLFMNTLSHSSFIITLLFAAILFLAPFLVIKRKYIYLYLAGNIGVLFILIFIYRSSALRHWGHLFILFVMCLWLSDSDKYGAYLINKKFNFIRIKNIIFSIILILSISGSAIAFYFDYKYPFSNAKALAEYIEEKYKLDEIIIVGHKPVIVKTVSIYLDKAFFYSTVKDFKKYVESEKSLKNIDPEEVFSDAYSLAKKDNDVLVIISKSIELSEDIPKQFNFKKINLNLKTPIVADEDFYLYVFNN